MLSRLELGSRLSLCVDYCDNSRLQKMRLIEMVANCISLDRENELRERKVVRSNSNYTSELLIDIAKP